ncbi:MAG: PilW family protein [Burkholderiaceae bacterium]|nr:PilW family protein [Burkholderiaceae bacterium]
MHTFSSRRRQLGLTLIEAMISIAIGLVVVSAVSYMYLGSKGAYRGNESVAQIQDAGRFALDAITRDVRRTGALGCGTLDSVTTSTTINITVLPTTTTAVDATKINIDPLINQPMSIRGFQPAAYGNGVQTAAPAGWTVPAGGPAYFNGDVLQLQIASGAPVRVTTKPDPVAGLMTIANNSLNGGLTANFSNAEYALLGNCAGATILQVVNNPAPTQLVAVQFATGNVAAFNQTDFATTTLPTLQHFDQVTYYVGRGATSTALYRYSLSAGTPPQEVVENIEDMDVVYGVDTSGAHASANIYEHANSVTGAAGNNWSNVVSVRISVIGVGDQLGAAPQPQTLLFRGPDPNPVPVPQVAADTRLRQVFTATATLRDRITLQ